MNDEGARIQLMYLDGLVEVKDAPGSHPPELHFAASKCGKVKARHFHFDEELTKVEGIDVYVEVEGDE
jgi:hypothetical protein